MKRFLFCSLLLCFYTASAQTIDHSRWTKILQTYVAENGVVNYKGLQGNQKSLQNYLIYLAENAPQENWSKTEKMTYWINAYNAYTIQLIVDNYPTESIKDISDPWEQTFFEIGGKKMSLNTIEHEILRPMGDPRIHFAIVCASESCPKLLNCAYESNTVSDQLDQAAREFINDPSKNNITESKITISKIFKWFKSDFPKEDAFIRYLNKYSAISISSDPKINYKTYEWALNE